MSRKVKKNLKYQTIIPKLKQYLTKKTYFLNYPLYNSINNDAANCIYTFVISQFKEPIKKVSPAYVKKKKNPSIK